MEDFSFVTGEGLQRKRAPGQETQIRQAEVSGAVNAGAAQSAPQTPSRLPTTSHGDPIRPPVDGQTADADPSKQSGASVSITHAAQAPDGVQHDDSHVGAGDPISYAAPGSSGHPRHEFAARFRDVLSESELPSRQAAAASTSGQPQGTAAYLTSTGTMHGVIPAGHANNTAPVVPGQYLASAMVVSRRQQGNPVLKHLKHVRWQFGDIVPDYLLGASSCALFLSLRFHALHPDYLSQRIRELQMAFRLRIVLCHLDTEDPARPLHAIMKACSAARCALVCAWSPQECARYLETFKAYEHRPADAILGRIERDYHARLSAALTSVRGVNRSDVISMGTTLGSLSAVLRAPRDALEGCAGIGPTKARRLFAAFHEPFRKKQRGGVAAQKPPEKRVPEYVAWNSRGGSDRAAGDMAQTGSGAGEGQAEGRDNEDAAGDDRNEGDEGGAAADGEGTGLSGHRALADVDAAFLGVGGEAFEGQEGGESGGED